MSASLLESIGPGPISELPVTLVALSADDTPSAVTSFLRRNADGSPVYSCERWLRLSFTAPVFQLRVWADNYAPNPGWTVRYGIRSSYRAPAASRSDTAINLLPTVDPGAATPNFMLNSATLASFSPYLVLQATVLVNQGGSLQSPPLNLHFAWGYV